VDPEFCQRWEPEAGFFGFFECVDDPEAAAGLFEAVEGALREKGKTRMLGPVNLTTHDEVGLLVEGFDSPPMVLSPYNPPFYEALLNRCGLSPCHDYYSYSWRPDASREPPVNRLLKRISQQRDSSKHVRVRRMDPRHREAENRLLFELYNTTFTSNWGFVPLTWCEFLGRSKSFQSFYRPEYLIFAEIDGRAVGFALTLPDINEALAKAGGRLLPMGWLQLARGIRRLCGARLLLLGVLPEFRGLGVAALLAEEQAKTARRFRVRRAELSLVHEANRRMRHVINAFGGAKCRTYRVFEKKS
jgi:GNAT superfamily N-acetyltransferase